MPILGVVSSSTLNIVNSYVAIDSYTVGSGGVTSFVFNSIPQTYTHLQVRLIARGLDSGTTGTQLTLRPNSSTSTYYIHGMQANKTYGGAGGYNSAGSNNTAGQFYWFSLPAANAAANAVGTGVIDIFDYATTNKKKTIKYVGGFERGTFGQVSFQSMLWTDTAAVTSLRLSSGSGAGFTEGSVFSLYGIKG